MKTNITLTIIFGLFFSFCCFSVINAQADSRDKRITYSARDVPLWRMFKVIKKQTSLTIFASQDILDFNEKVSVAFRQTPLEDALSILFSGKDLAWNINDVAIVLRQKNSQPQAPPPDTTRPLIVVTGKVADSKGIPLPGVTVVVKGTANGTVTGTDGNFLLRNISPDATLVFSIIGMKSQEVKVNGQASKNIVMEEDAVGMNELVVVGYGTQKKVNLTGAVASISGAELVNKPVTGTVDALQGVIPGVVVTKSNGSPGQENYNIQIRGMTSATNNPVLVLIDGIEGDIDDVRPEDVESISVLKDAASAAIYGAKAAGGVILITTKRGKAGKTSIEFNSYYTLAKLGRIQDRISSYQAALMRNEAEINSGGSAPLSDDDLAKLADPNFLWDTNPSNPNEFRYWGDYDYKKLVLKTFTPMTSHNLAISGGTGKTTFRISGTYFKNDGSLKIGPDSDTKYAARLNLNTEINKYLELSNVLSYSNNQIEKPWQTMDGDYGLWSYIFTYPGVTPLYDPNGHHAFGVRVGTFDGRIKFFQYDFDHGLKSWDQNNIRATSTLTIKNLVKNLQLRVVGGIDGNFDKTFFHSKQIEYYGVDGSVLDNLTGTNVTKGQANSALKEFQFLADYNLQLRNHGLALFAGYSVQDYRYSYFDGYIQDLINENLPSFDWASLDNMKLTDDAASYRYQSVFGRLQYNYHDRYLFETDLRYDGSSKLNPDDRYRLFPSVSAAWRISEENWFNINPISELKLRASFGQLGNANAIGNYDYIPLLSVNNDLALGSSGGQEQKAQYIYQSQLASKNITWETVETSNIGLDVSLFNNKLTIEGDYYIKKNKNMLAAVAYPSVLGVGVGNQNVGELKTWGWEVNIGWRGSSGAFAYWVNANIDDSQNKLINYLGATVINPGTIRLLEDYPINSIFGYKTDGLFQTTDEVAKHAFQSSLTGPGDVKYIDLDGDGKITSGKQTEKDHGDLVYIGNSNPRYNFGIRGGFSWKGIDFSMFLQGVGKRVFMLDEQFIMPYSYPEFGPQKHNLDYWTPENRDAFWPRLMVRGTHNFLPSDKWIQDAAYIRLKDIQIGYTIPNRLLSRTGITKLRVYIGGRDVWEATGTLAFIDPETPNQATYQYPFRRSYTAGINLDF